MRLVVLFLVTLAAGCGDDTTVASNPQDLSAPSGGDLAIDSLCGHPGDPGNDVGVGKFCKVSSDCAGLKASFCSTVMPIPQGPVYFCTVPCAAGDSSGCGTGATCTCLDPNNPTLCGCVPDLCRIGLFG
jgi:hypothetical protein